MPLMAHKDHGFHQASGGEETALLAKGWELCDDPIAYKRRVWGIDVQPEKKLEEPPQVATVTQAFPQVEPARRGRPRKVA